MTCVEKRFIEAYPRPSGKSYLLVSEFFNISEKMVSKVSVLDTKGANRFLESLHFDDSGNLRSTLNIKTKLIVTSALITTY